MLWYIMSSLFFIALIYLNVIMIRGGNLLGFIFINVVGGLQGYVAWGLLVIALTEDGYLPL